MIKDDILVVPTEPKHTEELGKLLYQNYFAASPAIQADEEFKVWLVNARLAEMVGPERKGQVFVAIEGNALISLAYVCPDNRRGGWIVEDLFTKPTHERQGIASRLLGVCEQFARDNRETSIHLSVDSRNSTLVSFYEHRGWVAKQFGEASGYIDPENERVPTYLMTKVLALGKLDPL